jgi:ribulose 1,5-bisphosphate synthetase/thiazole synthase
MAEGTRCATNAAGPEPGGELRTDVAILGSGPGGLSAAWQLSRAGHRDFIMLDGPEFGGNAAGGQFGEIGFRAARITCHCLRRNRPTCARCWPTSA